jgi:ComF family protein
MQYLVNLLQTISSYALTTACVACQQFQTQSICNDCVSLLKTGGLFQYECCIQCGDLLQSKEIHTDRCEQCKNIPPFFDQTHCLARYDDVLQEALHLLKYQKRIAMANGLAQAWNEVQTPYVQSIHADYLIPVPLSNEKLLARGFNQSWEIARRLHCHHSIQKLMNALKRQHHPKPQAGSSLALRQNALQKMFYIDKQYIDRLANKTVIVFDDVMTSGATLNEVARTLKNNGVKRVINWVLLRTTRLAR